MTAPTERRSPETQADQLVRDILKAAQGWSREAPPALQPAVRAVTIRLGELVADQRNYFAPLPGPQEAERTTILALVAKLLASEAVAEGLEVSTAVQYLERCAREVPGDQSPDPYWADDVVAGVIASVRAVLGIDELHARTEAQYPGGRRSNEQPEVEE
jgi:hypothetical protein